LDCEYLGDEEFEIIIAPKKMDPNQEMRVLSPENREIYRRIVERANKEADNIPIRKCIIRTCEITEEERKKHHREKFKNS
jgi:hypothetical protein